MLAQDPPPDTQLPSTGRENGTAASVLAGTQRHYLTCVVRPSPEKEPERFLEVVEHLAQYGVLQALQVGWACCGLRAPYPLGEAGRYQRDCRDVQAVSCRWAVAVRASSSRPGAGSHVQVVAWAVLLCWPLQPRGLTSKLPLPADSGVHVPARRHRPCAPAAPAATAVSTCSQGADQLHGPNRPGTGAT